MRRVAIILVAVFAALATSGGTAAADGTYVFGPYTVISPDSGTCGNDWATETFTRRILVKSNGDGTYGLRFINTDGTFVTNPGRSPGGCENSERHGTSIRAGVTGQMHGTLEATVSGGSFNPSATCGNPCFMFQFVSDFFGPLATRTDERWSYEYSSGAPDLVYRHWTNASRGNSGDIASQ